MQSLKKQRKPKNKKNRNAIWRSFVWAAVDYETAKIDGNITVGVCMVRVQADTVEWRPKPNTGTTLHHTIFIVVHITVIGFGVGGDPLHAGK